MSLTPQQNQETKFSNKQFVHIENNIAVQHNHSLICSYVKFVKDLHLRDSFIASLSILVKKHN